MFEVEALIRTLGATIAFALLAPIAGCLLSGVDRIISARMQGRIGPPLLQPYYDVRKLLEKEDAAVNSSEGVYITCALVSTMIAGGVFFAGGNLLLSVFLITLSALFFIVAAYSSRSPYAEIGANRETIQVMAYEPMIILMAVAYLAVVGSFNTADVFLQSHPLICNTLGIFLGFLFVLTIKLRKSPFDLSMSHHAHQEIVKGITTEMSGPTLAKVEIMHWVENILFLAWTGIFFIWANPISIIVAIVAVVLIYFFEIYIDNNFARVKWQFMLKSAWIITAVLSGINLALVIFGPLAF